MIMNGMRGFEGGFGHVCDIALKPLPLDGGGYEDLAACCLVVVGEGERRFTPREALASLPLAKTC